MKTCVCRKEITGCLCSISSVIVFSSFLCFFTARKYAQPQRRKLCSCALKDTLQGLLYFWVNSIKSPERQTHQPTMRLRSDWCPGAVMTPVLINVLVPKGGGGFCPCLGLHYPNRCAEPMRTLPITVSISKDAIIF